MSFPLIASAVDYNVHGIIDIRATSTDSLTSYIEGGYGKFALDDGQELSLAQAGIELNLHWENNVSAHIVTNGYANGNETVFGLTEGFVKYKSLPTESGYRWQLKAGIFYPEISLENDAFAWASKYTLNSSTLNTWIGEEIRVLGSEIKVTRLGKFHQANYDISLSASIFGNNDPAGSLLSWHGWTSSSRQTLWTESIPITYFKAREKGYDLYTQAAKSDPFLELDDDLGFHTRAEIKLFKKGELNAGYYDNKATPYIVENGQYAWRTKFYHLGAKWFFDDNLQLYAQYLHGDTLMQNIYHQDIVNNQYASGYVALTKRWQKHRATIRAEEFSVTDRDNTLGDNNNEYGKSLTANYSYRYAKNWFLSAEYNWINSYRWARWYVREPINLIERQWQLSARYFF